VANLFKTLHTNFYQNRSTYAAVMHKSVLVCFMAHSVLLMRQWATSLFDLTFTEPIRWAKVWSKYLLKPKKWWFRGAKVLRAKVWSKYILRPKSGWTVV